MSGACHVEDSTSPGRGRDFHTDRSHEPGNAVVFGHDIKFVPPNRDNKGPLGIKSDTIYFISPIYTLVFCIPVLRQMVSNYTWAVPRFQRTRGVVSWQCERVQHVMSR